MKSLILILIYASPSVSAIAAASTVGGSSGEISLTFYDKSDLMRRTSSTSITQGSAGRIFISSTPLNSNSDEKILVLATVTTIVDSVCSWQMNGLKDNPSKKYQDLEEKIDNY